MTALNLTMQLLTKTLLTIQEQVMQNCEMQEQGRPDHNHTTTETAKEVLRGCERANEAIAVGTLDMRAMCRQVFCEIDQIA